MGAAGWAMALSSFLAFADDPPLRPDSEPRYVPRFGVTGGVHLGTVHWAWSGPQIGARAGMRFRLLEHLGATVQVGWDHAIFFQPGRSTFRVSEPDTNEPVHDLSVSAGLELFTTSAFERLFVPELSVSLLGGITRTVSTHAEAIPARGSLGVRFQMLRLWPSQWWFPVYVQLVIDVYERGVAVSSIAAGLGI